MNNSSFSARTDGLSSYKDAIDRICLEYCNTSTLPVHALDRTEPPSRPIIAPHPNKEVPPPRRITLTPISREEALKGISDNIFTNTANKSDVLDLELQYFQLHEKYSTLKEDYESYKKHAKNNVEYIKYSAGVTNFNLKEKNTELKKENLKLKKEIKKQQKLLEYLQKVTNSALPESSRKRKREDDQCFCGDFDGLDICYFCTQKSYKKN